MNILAVTKFPPIQGGESASALFLFDELGKRNHTITVLSNFDDVSQQNKAVFSRDDFAILRANKNLNIVSVKQDAVPDFIPRYDPKTEKLLNEGLKLIAGQKFDLIFGWYLLPYVSAAYLLSKIFSIPLVIQHGGSDLARLYPRETLHQYFLNIIEASTGIMTHSLTSSYFNSKPPESVFLQKQGLPNMFNPHGSQVDFFEEFHIECDLNSTFLCLGKFSMAKGFYEIIEAFRLVENATLIIFSPNKRSISIELPKNVFVREAVAPWRVPGLLRSVKALIVPEWNFGVAIHRSTLPIQSILCGKIALVSNQIVENYPGLQQFMIGIDTLKVSDTVSKIKHVAKNEFINEPVRSRYREIRSKLPSFTEYVDEVELFLEGRIRAGQAADLSREV
jgi:glycosyltransferase involved in cell wall biosynthesis